MLGSRRSHNDLFTNHFFTCLRITTTKSDVVFVVELVLFVEGYGFVEFSDDCGTADVLKFLIVLLVQLAEEVVHDVTRLLL